MATRSRGQMIPKGQNLWLLRVYLGKDAAGKRMYSAKTIEGTTAQARKELTAMNSSVDTQTFVAPSRVTLKEYLDAWLKGRIDLTPISRQSYTYMLSFFDGIGHLKLCEVTRERVQETLTGMTEQGFSRRTVQYARSVLHAAFESAIEQSLLARNPSDHTKLPPKVKRAPSVLSMAQVSLFLEKTKDHPHHAFWSLQFTSGLRPQEAYALKWSDIDLEGRWLSVRRVIAGLGQGRYALVDSAKTEGSIRRISIPATTIEILKAHKKAQAVEIMAAGSTYNRQDLVFASATGGLLDPSKVRRAFKAALKAAELPIVRHYDTRHTHLTALLSNRADIAWVASRAGHANIQMTRDHYAHVLPEVHREMGEMTERMLQEAR